MSTLSDTSGPDTRNNIEINIGKVCNSRCIFCLDAPSADTRQLIPFEDMKREIRHWAERGHRSLGILGGEPTLYPRLGETIAHAKASGFTRITIATNGMRLDNPERTDALLDAGLTRVTISMHGHTAELEDRLTGVDGSYSRKSAAIAHLLRRQQQGRLADGVSVNVVLNGLNYRQILPIQKFFFSQLGLQDLRVNFIRAEGRASESRELTPSFTAVLPDLMKAVVLNEMRYYRTFTLGGFPLCVFPASFQNEPDLLFRYVGEFRDLLTDCSVSSEGFRSRYTKGGRDRFRWKEVKQHQLKAHPDACSGCAIATICEGVWRAYLDIHGDRELVRVDASSAVLRRLSEPAPA